MTATDRAVELAVAAATAAADKQATEILALDVSDQLVITDAFVLAAAANPRQLRSVVDAVEESLSALGAKLLRREGVSEARWVLLDYAEIVVHVQLAEDRQYYALERLWKDGPVIPLPAEVIADGAGAPGAGGGPRAGAGAADDAGGPDAGVASDADSGAAPDVDADLDDDAADAETGAGAASARG